MFDQFLTKLKNLKPDTKPQWGKMTAQHMVEHLITAVQMSNGKVHFDCFNPPEKLPALRRFLMSDRPLPRNFVNPVIGSDNLPLKYSDLKEAKEILEMEIKDYHKFFESNPEAKPTNVTFGELNKEEWDQFHKKHFTHHFTQFNLLD